MTHPQSMIEVIDLVLVRKDPGMFLWSRKRCDSVDTQQNSPQLLQTLQSQYCASLKYHPPQKKEKQKGNNKTKERRENNAS